MRNLYGRSIDSVAPNRTRPRLPKRIPGATFEQRGEMHTEAPATEADPTVITGLLNALHKWAMQEPE